MYFLYSCVGSVALTLVSPWLLWQAWRHGKYTDAIGERFGRLPAALGADGRPSVWVHAVSVGEVLAARALLPALRERFPGHAIVVSTTTRTGRQIAARQLPDLDGLFYLPLDFAFSVRRVLRRLRPALLVIVETEIWPRLIRESRRQGVPVVLVNARVSDRSFPRYRAARALLRPVLDQVALLCAQSDLYAERLRQMGAPADRVVVTGSLKYDALDWSLLERSATHPVLASFSGVGTRPVLLAASTLRGEDALVLDAFEALREREPSALLLLVPRHPERFDEVTALASGRGLRVVRRTSLAPGAPLTADVVIVDTVGELAALFGLATVVFVGGSLVDAGGHNVLEPALFGRAIVVGPSMHNFPDIAQTFLDEGALVQVSDARAFTQAVLELFASPACREALGANARVLVQRHRGAALRTLEAIGRVTSGTSHAPREAAGTRDGRD
jgi:3-deoxy-D-manno-octulosonic-acid transferase